MDEYKTCTKCGQTKTRSSEFFYRNKKSPDGLRPDCAECGRNRSRKYAQENAEANRARVKKWRESDLERTRLSKAEYYQRNKKAIRDKWKSDYRANPEKFYTSGRRRRAREKLVPTESYTADQILQLYGTNCHICGLEIDLTAPRHNAKPNWEYSLHLDHVIPISKGGPDLIENIRPAHGLCNIKKGNKHHKP